MGNFERASGYYPAGAYCGGIKHIDIAEKLEVTTRTIEREMKKLRESGRVTRVGGKRYGHWEVR